MPLKADFVAWPSRFSEELADHERRFSQAIGRARHMLIFISVDTSCDWFGMRFLQVTGYFDYRFESDKFAEGYQSVPVDWGISYPRKKGFFELAKHITQGD